MNDKKTGLLNMSNPEAYLDEVELRKRHILDWQKQFPDLYKSFEELSKDDLIYLLFDKYIAPKFDEVSASTPAKKAVSTINVYSNLLNVLMEESTSKEKHLALNKWEADMLEIAGNNSARAFKIGRTAGATKVRVEENPKIEAIQKRKVILDNGRTIGAQIQKNYADETKEFIQIINSDLLKHADTARWTLDERAKHIEKKLVTINRKQINRTPYKFSTIKKFITGKG